MGKTDLQSVRVGGAADESNVPSLKPFHPHKSPFPAICLSLSSVDVAMGFSHGMEVLVGSGRTACGFTSDGMMKQAMRT